MIRLHGFSQSGNTFKVAFFLRTLGVPFEPVLVDFMHGATREPEWRAKTNEMGEVPVFDTIPSGIIQRHCNFFAEIGCRGRKRARNTCYTPLHSEYGCAPLNACRALQSHDATV